MIDLKTKFPRMFSLIEDLEFSERETYAIYIMCLTIDNHEKALQQRWNENVDHVVFQQILDSDGNVRVYYKGGDEYCHGVTRMLENLLSLETIGTHNEKNETIHPKVWCDPPGGWKFGFPKIYDRNKHPDFYKWIVEEGYPQKEIDSLGEHFYCRWWNEEEE